MKILSCVTSYKEVELIKNAGADEIYFGLSHSYLSNASNHGNVGLKEAKQIINLAHNLGLKVHLAANGNCFNHIRYQDSLKIIKKMIDWGINGVIVSSLGLLNELKDINITIHISSVNPIFNLQYLDFLNKNFKISRIILPNQISSNESRNIIEYCKKYRIETEIFFFKFFGCPYINGFCYLHASPMNCMNYSVKTPPKKTTTIISCHNIPRILNSKSFIDFWFMGVDYTKYGTRTDPTHEKVKKVKFIKFTLKYIDELNKRFPNNPEKLKNIFVSTIDEMYGKIKI